MTDRSSDAGDRRAPRDERDLTGLVEELSTTLDALRDAVEDPSGGRPSARRGRGVTPGPTPPTPRELLRFTEQYTIPTLIALLESGVRSLELLRATLRLLDGRGIEGASPATRERVQSVGRTTLGRVDAALSDLSSAVEGGESTDPDARDLLAEARALREEIDDRLREAGTADGGRDRDGTDRRTSGRAPGEGRTIPVRPAEAADEEAGEDDADVPVDVDAELASIREDVAREEGEASTEHGPGGGSGDGEGDESGSGDEGESGSGDEGESGSGDEHEG